MSTVTPPRTPVGVRVDHPVARRRGLQFTGKMMAPGVAVLLLLSVVPTVALVLMSFSTVSMIGGVRLHWAGFDNWVRVFSDGAFWRSWLTTVVYLVLTLGLELVLGIAFALGLHRLARTRSVLLSLLLLPMFVAPVIAGLLGRFLTDSTFGLYSWLLRGLGFTGDVFTHGASALVTVVLIDVWEWTPLLMLITLAGLTNLNPSVVEAAQLDGASGLKMLRHITLPSIAPILVVGLLIRSMDAVRYFDVITITTNGGPADATKTAPIRLFETAFRFLDFGYAAVTGIVMLAFTILIARGFLRVLGRQGAAS